MVHWFFDVLVQEYGDQVKENELKNEVHHIILERGMPIEPMTVIPLEHLIIKPIETVVQYIPEKAEMDEVENEGAFN